MYYDILYGLIGKPFNLINKHIFQSHLIYIWGMYEFMFMTDSNPVYKRNGPHHFIFHFVSVL